MKRIFIKMLPVMAAVLFATSCGKDEGGNSVIDNVVAPQEDTIQDDVKSSVKTITITGKVNQASLSKVCVEEGQTLKLELEGNEEFKFSNCKDGDEAVFGSIAIKGTTGEYEAAISFHEEEALTVTGGFTATLNEHSIGLVGTDNLSDAVKAACYAIDFNVTKENDEYKMKSGDAEDIVINVESAFIQPQSDGWLTVSGRSYHVTGGKCYIVSNKSEMGVTKAIEAGKIYKVSSPASERKVPEGYVDLGITVDGKKVFWAEKNVGADNPWDYGDYYAWGETVPYYADNHAADNPCSNWRTIVDRTITGYNWATYFDSDEDGENFSKYADASSATLESDDDAATQNFDAASSMPTEGQWQALVNASHCTWVWTSEYDGHKVAGYIVYAAGTDPHTIFDTHIFLPAAGYRGSTNLYRDGVSGQYWSSSRNTYDPRYVWGLGFTSSRAVMTDSYSRFCGESVRPVRLQD